MPIIQMEHWDKKKIKLIAQRHRVNVIVRVCLLATVDSLGMVSKFSYLKFLVACPSSYPRVPPNTWIVFQRPCPSEARELA